MGRCQIVSESRQAHWNLAHTHENWLVVPVKGNRGWSVAVYPPDPYGKQEPVLSGKAYSSVERALATGKAEIERRKMLQAWNRATHSDA